MSVSFQNTCDRYQSTVIKSHISSDCPLPMLVHDSQLCTTDWHPRRQLAG